VEKVLFRLAVAILCVAVASVAPAQSSRMTTIRYDANGRPIVQEASETKSTSTPHGPSLSSVASKLNAQGTPVLSRESTVTTTQPSARVRQSESTTQIRDSQGNVRSRARSLMTETQVSSDTTRTETVFQESRGSEMATTARMVETRKETSSGSEYQRTFEARTHDGEFRPRQKVESQTTQYSTGGKRTRTVESAVDRNGNVRPTQEMVERESAEFWGKQTIERIIKRIEAGGDAKLDRVEIEQRNLRATTGVLNEKVIKKPDGSLGLRETQIITTSAGTHLTGDPIKIIVTKEYPRNDRFGSPVITEVVIEKTMHRADGASYIERELKVRDVNGNLTTLTVTQIETTPAAPASR
jgi:hypothetical protein